MKGDERASRHKALPSASTSSASRASACSTEGLPGESLFTPLFSPPPRRLFIHAASRASVSSEAFNLSKANCSALSKKRPLAASLSGAESARPAQIGGANPAQARAAHDAVAPDHRRRRPCLAVRREQNRGRGRGAAGRGCSARHGQSRPPAQCSAAALHRCHACAPGLLLAARSAQSAHPRPSLKPDRRSENRREKRRSKRRRKGRPRYSPVSIN